MKYKKITEKEKGVFEKKREKKNRKRKLISNDLNNIRWKNKSERE